MSDGTYADYHANNPIEYVNHSVDDFGYSELLMEDIIDHNRNIDAIDKRDGWMMTQYGSTKRVITAKGWHLKILWKDSTSSWGALKDINKSNPVEVAEYATRSNISNDPTFAWWVNYTLKRRSEIIKEARHRLAKKAFKFGVKVPVGNIIYHYTYISKFF